MTVTLLNHQANLQLKIFPGKPHFLLVLIQINKHQYARSPSIAQGPCPCSKSITTGTDIFKLVVLMISRPLSALIFLLLVYLSFIIYSLLSLLSAPNCMLMPFQGHSLD